PIRPMNTIDLQTELVTLTTDGAIATLTLNRPDARNALSLEMIAAMEVGLEKIESGLDGVAVVILAGAGKSFCAGMDLKAVQDDPILMGDMLRRLAAVSRRIRRLDYPTIARVQGAAIGGGGGLMVVCDFSFAHPEAKLGYPEVDLGICPAVVAPFLVKRIGAGKARAMLLAGGTMGGEAGFDAGLATHLVAMDELESATIAFAERLAKGGPEAIRATKRWLNELDGSLDDEQLSKGAEISAELIQTEDAQARLRTLFKR
ncbi:MAG: enoyl-CoA hydratase/isomerase family protein, partial [Planctomycetota bacterium]|nr:enoyl-CoA hydratase/isomerase family protein [Planctomycetota bacterium]